MGPPLRFVVTSVLDDRERKVDSALCLGFISRLKARLALSHSGFGVTFWRTERLVTGLVSRFIERKMCDVSSP